MVASGWSVAGRPAGRPRKKTVEGWGLHHPFSDPRARLSHRSVWPPPFDRKYQEFRLISCAPLRTRSSSYPSADPSCPDAPPAAARRSREGGAELARHTSSEKAAPTSGEGAGGCLARSVLRTERKNSRRWGGACFGEGLLAASPVSSFGRNGKTVGTGAGHAQGRLHAPPHRACSLRGRQHLLRSAFLRCLLMKGCSISEISGN